MPVRSARIYFDDRLLIRDAKFEYDDEDMEGKDLLQYDMGDSLW